MALRKQLSMNANSDPSSVSQGDLFWIESDASRGSVPGTAHPHVISDNTSARRAHWRAVAAEQVLAGMCLQQTSFFDRRQR
jgi:hypothetical protein